MDLPEKKEKRINDLIKSGKTALVLTILSLFLGPVGPLLMAVGWLYYWETGRLHKKFPGMPEQLAADLLEARKRFFWLGLVPLIWYAALILMMTVIVIVAESTR